MHARLAVGVMLAGWLTGCSLIGARWPNPAQGPAASCTESSALPVLDTVAAAAFLGLGTAALVCNGSPSCSKPHPTTGSIWNGQWDFDFKPDYGVLAAIGLSAGALLAGSATYGYLATSRCRAVKQGEPSAQVPPVAPVQTLLPVERAPCIVVPAVDRPVRCVQVRLLDPPPGSFALALDP